MEKNPFYCSFSPLTVLFIAYFFQAFEVYLIVPIFQYLAPQFGKSPFFDSLGLSLSSVSLIVYYLSLIVLNPYIGAFADSFGKRKALLLIEFLRFVSFLLCGLGYSIAFLALYLFARFIYGVSSTVSSVSQAAIADLYDDFKSRIRGFGLIRIVDGILHSFYLYVITTLSNPSFDPIPSPNQLYLIASLICLLVFFFLYTNFKETQAQVHGWNGPWLRCYSGFGQILKEPQVKFLLLIYILWSYSFAWLSKTAASELYLRSGETFLILFLFLFVCVLGTAAYFLVPLIFPRIGTKRIFLLSLGGPALLAAFNLIGYSIPVITILLCGLSTGMFMPLFPWLLGQIIPSSRLGRIYALKHAIWGAGIFICYAFPINPLPFLLLSLFLLVRFHPRPEFCPPAEYAGE